ncbi:MAG: efflux RND transporter periplasmic adaptor subunit [Candidatus Ventricola sp.]
MKKKRRWIKWIILAAAVLLIVGWFVFFSRQTQSAAYTGVPVTQGDLTTYYNFDGLVYAPRTQTITASQAGTVRTVYVTQNQQVRKGDRLYRLEGGETVESDIDGELTSLSIAAGDVVTAGETVAQIIDMDRLEVRLDVDEYDVHAVKPGNAVSVTILATDEQLESAVSAIDKNGTASGDLSYYTATVPIGEAEDAYPGMQVSAKMLRDQVLGAALLRLDAVQFDEYNRPYVYVGTAKEPQRLDVTLGSSDGVMVEIQSGLKPGDTVLKPSGISMMELMEQMREQRSAALGK